MAQTVDLGQVVPDVTMYPKYAYDVYTIDKEWEVAFSESSTSVRLQNIYKPNVKIIMFPFLSIVFEMYGIEYNETVSSSNGGLFICYDELNVSNLYVKRATHANEFY